MVIESRATATEHQNRLLGAIGALEGPAALEWLSNTLDSNGQALDTSNRRMILTVGWVKAKQREAAKWITDNPDHTLADEVAFQLAISTMKEDPARAREWAGEILDPHLSETIGDIISR